MTERKIRVAVLFGGRSAEHSVSCISAGSVLAALDRDRYDVQPIGITPDGRWVLAPDDPAALGPHGRELPTVDARGTAVALPADPTSRRLLVLDQRAGAGAFGDVDVVFPLLHGPWGEDGTVQGLLEMAGVPYVGSGVFASAAAMDKTHMKTLLVAAGLPVTPHVVVRVGEPPLAVRGRVEPLGLPVFVKPARAGSSLGISKVSSYDALPAALATALDADPKVLVEAMVIGREVECGVLERLDGPAEASLPAEVRVADDAEFYDFEAKYLSDATAFDVPAKLSDELTERVRESAVRAFTALDCAGLARVDFFVRDDDSLVVNEVNTMPGFTPMSMFPRMWEVTGVDYATVVDRLIQLALRRGTGLH